MTTNTIHHKSQPASLYTLSFAEGWDRFSYYGIQAWLVLYATQMLLFSDKQAYELYGAFTALAFAMPVIGGLLADRLLGFRHAVIVGAILITIGNILLIFPGIEYLFLGLASMVTGIGLFKPNNANLIGVLYHNDDPRRDAGFSILYIAMNIGALLAPLVYGYTVRHHGWHYGFAISAVGMLLALGVFFYKERNNEAHVNHQAGKLTKKVLSFITVRHIFYFSILVSILIFALLMQYTHLFGNLLTAVGIITLLGLLLYSFKLTMPERKRLLGLTILCFFCIFFFACSLQIFTSLTLFIEREVNRNLFGIELPTMAFLALEPFFIVVAGPVLAFLWTRLAERKKDPSPGLKVSLGLLLAGLSFAIYALAANNTEHAYMAIAYIVIANFMLAVGELCISPVVIAAITHLAPVQMRGTMMGVFFLAIAYSGYLAGAIANLMRAEHLENASDIALAVSYSNSLREVCYITITIACVLFVINPLLKRLLQAKI